MILASKEQKLGALFYLNTRNSKGFRNTLQINPDYANAVS